MKRQLVSSDEAVATKNQHTTPCSDCPFSRSALRGWLGSMTVDEWIQAAHGESLIDCHVTTNQQCAGAAIYRANVCKSPRSKDIITLPPNRKTCFASAMEFKQHHTPCS